jgi:hypothetical protein
MRKLLIGLALLISLTSVGQETQYFSKYFAAKVTEKTNYVRKYTKEGEKTLIEDIQNNKLQMSGMILGTVDRNEIDDFVHYIRTLGQDNKYKNSFDKLNGSFTFYYKSGGHSHEVLFHDNKLLYSQLWTENGDAVLTNGTGINKSSADEENSDRYEEFKDSVVVSRYSIRHLQKDTIYSKVDKAAEPKEGIQKFQRDLVGILKYPSVAQIAGKEARVFVQFIVDERGKLTDFTPKTKEGYGFEKKVIQKLQTLPDWNPAVFNGRFVKQSFILPVNYQLK